MKRQNLRNMKKKSLSYKINAMQLKKKKKKKDRRRKENNNKRLMMKNSLKIKTHRYMMQLVIIQLLIQIRIANSKPQISNNFCRNLLILTTQIKKTYTH